MWSVWVGGSEMNSNLLSEGEAILVATDWLLRGYDDVAIDNYGA
jgi:hypothetical protein